MNEAMHPFTSGDLDAMLQPHVRSVLIVTARLADTMALQAQLQKSGRVLLYASTSESAMVLLRQCLPQVVVVDDHLEEGEGHELVARIRHLNLQTSIIRRSGDLWLRGGIDRSSHPRTGLPGPGAGGSPQLRLVPALPASQAAANLPKASGEPALVGESPPMRQLKATLADVRDAWLSQPAGSMPGVLITGESGTGKRLAARTLHQMLGLEAGHFLALDCGSMHPGYLEEVLSGRAAACRSGATLFLHELADLHQSDQTVLRRFIDEWRLRPPPGMPGGGLRLIVASCHELEPLVLTGGLDPCLYRSLVMMRGVAIPPLRERPGDVPRLVRHFAEQIGGHYGKPGMQASGAVLMALERRSWPGNVRELRNAIEEAIILGPGGLLDKQSA